MLPNPLPQSDAYANTLRALGTQVRIDAIEGTGRCLIQTRRLPLIGPVNLISRGPVGLTPESADAYLRDLRLRGPLVINALTPPHGGIRLAAPRRIALLPLGTGPQMRAVLHPKWRNALHQAEASGLTLDITPYKPDRHRWLITAEAVQQATRGYRNWPITLLDAFARENPGQARVITACRGSAPLAAVLILCHRPWASYHLGLTTFEGRTTEAHRLALWHAMGWLAQRGYDTLDLGLLTGPPGLDRFKIRTGARVETLGGTWLRLPRIARQFPSIQVPSGQKA